MKLKKVLATLLSAALLTTCFAGCGGSKDASSGNASAGDDENKLVIYCPHPLSFINPLVEEFEKESGIKVEVVAAGTGELLKRVESEKANPLADIFWGGSLSTMKPKANLFEPYKSANEEHVQDAFKNTEGSITRFTDIPSVIMVNTDLIGDIKVEGYEDLLNPALKGKIAMADPSKSSSSYEHLINMLYAMGNGDPDKGWDYVEKFCRNLDGKRLLRRLQGRRGRRVRRRLHLRGRRRKIRRGRRTRQARLHEGGRHLQAGRHLHHQACQTHGKRQEIHRLHHEQGSPDADHAEAPPPQRAR